MNRFGLILLAAIAGSVITLGIVFIPSDNHHRSDAGVHYMEEMYPAEVLYSDDTGKSGFIPQDFTEASKKVMDAVVHIRSTQTVRAGQGSRPQQVPDPFRDFFGDDFFDRFFGPDGGQGEMPPQRRMGTGSGVVINEDGYIVTNNHVIANAEEIQVTLHDNRTYQATVVGADPSTDLALVRIEEEGLPFISLVNSDSVEVGQWVLAVGNPFNLTSTVTAGIVSATARNINIMRDQYAIESFIQTDAAINPGNSGGALVNLQGGLVGINTAIASPTGSYSGYGFAIPSNLVGKIVEDLLEFGTVQRGYLGVIIRNIDGNFAREKGLDITEGVYIDSVLSNSAAEKAGIREGDVVTRINDKEITKSSELQEIIARQRPGDEVDMMVYRKGKPIPVTATLQSREGRTETITRETSDVLVKLGVELAEITTETANQLNIHGGVKVTRLHAGIIRQHTDMREGFIITRINNQKVASADDFVSILEGHEGGVLLEGVYEDIKGTYYYAFGL